MSPLAKWNKPDTDVGERKVLSPLDRLLAVPEEVEGALIR